MRRCRHEPSHQSQTQHGRSEHKQTPSPAPVRDKMGPKLSMHEVIGPQRFGKRRFGHTKHHLSPLFMALERNPLLCTTLLKPSRVVGFTKDEHVVSRVTWVRVMIDPSHGFKPWAFVRAW